MPGRGHLTPIVFGNRVFLTAAVPYGDALPPRPSAAPGNHDNLPVTHRQRFMALAASRNDGRILWQRKLHEALPQEQGHHTASLASNSPVTDGERLFAFFGSFGLYCLDVDGKLLWQRDFGPMQSLHGHGEGASPALYGATLCPLFRRSHFLPVTSLTSRATISPCSRRNCRDSAANNLIKVYKGRAGYKNAKALVFA